MKIKQHKGKRQAILKKEDKKASQSLFKSHFAYILLLTIITTVLFSGAVEHEFTNWDDNHYVTQNALVQDLSFQNTVRIFSSFVHSHYHPLTILSLAVDFHFWGLNPKGFIIVNIILHLLNVIMVFLILKLLSGDGYIALGAALIFAIHPMRVESVVWVTERKDVLYAFFYLLAIYHYIKYITSGENKKYYILTLLMFVLSLLSKALAASLPLVLLLLDYYHARKKFLKLIIEKIPFFALSLLFGVIAVVAQSGEVPNKHPFFAHLFLMSYALMFYLIKFFVPLFQSVLIEFPEKTTSYLPLKYYLSFLIIPVSIFLYIKLKKIRKELLFSFGFFMVGIILILIKFPVGPAYIAERYTYIPYMGLAFLISFIINKYPSGILKKTVFIIFFCWLLFLSYRTYLQIQVWENSESLWSNVIKHNPYSVIALNNRGDAKYYKGDYAGAIKDYDKALNINNETAGAYNNRANSKKQLNDLKGAIVDYNKALEIDCNYFDAYFNRAIAKDLLGDTAGALADNDKAIELKPNYADCYYNRANIKFKIGRIEDALKDYDKTITLNQAHADAYCNRGGAKHKLKDYLNAEKDYNKAIQLNPQYANAYNNRAVLRYEQGDTYNACLDWEQSKLYGNTSAQKLHDTYCK